MSSLELINDKEEGIDRPFSIQLSSVENWEGYNSTIAAGRGVDMSSPKQAKTDVGLPLAGKTVVVTGTFEGKSRDQMHDLIRANKENLRTAFRGARITWSKEKKLGAPN